MMNLQQALHLLGEASGDLTRANAIDVEKPDGWFGSDLPHENDLCVATRDGEDFWLLYSQGDYSDYGICGAVDREQWRKNNADWMNVYFNPDGVWKHCRVVAINPHSSEHMAKMGYQEEVLNCGRAIPLPPPGQRYSNQQPHGGGIDVECWECRGSVEILDAATAIQPATLDDSANL